MTACAVCGRPKEPTRVKSLKCRSCDTGGRDGGPRRRLTIDLPADVWDRLDAEARAKDQRIGGYLIDLITKRDARLVSGNKPDASN